MTFQKSVRHAQYARIAITGVSGAGGTYTALRIASGLSRRAEKKIALIDTQNDASNYYAERFAFDSLVIQPPYTQAKFVAAIKCAAMSGEYGVLIIDTLSHFHEAVMDYKDALDKRGGSINQNWVESTRIYREFFTFLLNLPLHVICRVRSKTENAVEERAGKKQVSRLAMSPLMKDGMEYEFPTLIEMSPDHMGIALKDYTGVLPAPLPFEPTQETGELLLDYYAEALPRPTEAMGEVWQNQVIKNITEKVTRKDDAPITFYTFEFESERRAFTLSKSLCDLGRLYGVRPVHIKVKDGTKPDTYELLEIDPIIATQ